MDNSSIYADIAARTGGNIYIGVVGPGAHRKIDLHQTIHGNARTAEYHR